MHLTSIPQFARNANRLREIVTILSRYGLADWISRLGLGFAKGLFKGPEGNLAELTTEVRIRLVLTELGPTFIKLGQMLSTRADLIGPELARELTALQASTPADPPAAVRATVEAELGRPLTELFAEFDDKPLASASIGQVHRARLPGGQAVVVKVQHPGIEGRVRNDLEILLGLADRAEQYLPEVRQYQPRSVAGEFQRTLLRELDFGREGRHLEQFAANFAGDKTVHFPRPFPELSTARVLTMELLEGVPLSQPQRIKELGHDPEEVARRGARTFLEMVFRDGFYHADPHPGNLWVLGGGVLGVLDCGMVGRLDYRRREEIEELLLAVATGDATGLCALIMQIGSAPPTLDQPAFAADVTEYLSYYSGQSLDKFDLGGALTEMTELVRRFHIVLPTGIALLIKVLVILEGTARLLNPHFNLTELIKPYQRQLLRRRLSPKRHLRKWWLLYREWERLGEVLPRSLLDIVQQMQRRRFEIHLEHHRMETTINRLTFGIATSALFLGSALLWSMKVPPLFQDVSMPGAVGCGTSAVLGMRLLWAIRRSAEDDRKP